MSNVIKAIFPRQSSTQNIATSLRVQTSVLGTPRPIGWGTARLAPNLLDYVDFKAVQVQQSSAGGKGAGGGTSGKFGGQTQTEYYVSIIMGLCEGPVEAIGTVWKGSNITSLGWENLTLYDGAYTQTEWSYMGTAHPSRARAYRGTAYIASTPFRLGQSPTLPAMNFEVQFGFLASSPPYDVANSGNGVLINGGTQTVIVDTMPGGQDANPSSIIVDFLTNTHYGVGFPATRVGDTNLITLWNCCQAVGIWMSPVLTSQTAANSFLADLLYGCVAEAVWSGGTLKVVPYYDAAAAANGGTYTPNLSPLYDLTDDDFIASDAGPIKITRKGIAERYNAVKIQYASRSNLYNPIIVDAKDDASIQAFGLRARDSKQLDYFCRDDSPQTCAHLQLGREQVIATYEFTVSAAYVLLEPMDPVTITDAALGLDRKLVRIKEITENADHTLSIHAEEMLVGAASPPLYGSQGNTGTVTNYNEDPGLTNEPYFFEPTDDLVGGLEVWMAVTPADLLTWGGCNVYLSYDGVNYQYAGQQLGPTRMGTLTAPLPSVIDATTPPTIDRSSFLSVDLSESGSELLTATEADLLAFATLCYVNGEFLAYQTATVTGANAYDLTDLNRGGYGTDPKASSAGDKLVRIDAGVFKIPFTQDRIGQTLYIKLVSFNQYGGGPQSLSTVSPYVYTIQGSALVSPLPDVEDFTTNYQSNITLFSWVEITDFRTGIQYEIRRGSSWASGQVIGRYAHPNVPAPGAGTYWIKAVCQPAPGLFVYSDDAISVVISGAVIPLNVLATFDEFATGLTGEFLGNLYNNGGVDIDVIGSGDLYDVSDVYALTNWYTIPGGASPWSGTYTAPLDHIIDVGRVVGCLIDCSWSSQAVPITQNIFDWADIFGMTDIFAADANVFITVYPNINLSQDGTNWSGWQRYNAGYYSAQAFRMQIYLETIDSNTISTCSSFTYGVHVPSRVDHYIGLSIGTGGTAVTFTPDGAGTAAAFHAGPGADLLPTWQATISDAQFGDQVNVSDLTLSGCTITVTNAGDAVARVINIEFAGY